MLTNICFVLVFIYLIDGGKCVVVLRLEDYLTSFLLIFGLMELFTFL